MTQKTELLLFDLFPLLAKNILLTSPTAVSCWTLNAAALIKILFFLIEYGLYLFLLGSVNKKKEKKKKKGLMYEELRLPAITAFSSCEHYDKLCRSPYRKRSIKADTVLFLFTAVTRQSDWDGIVACHRDRLATTTWNYQRCTMGAHHLQPPGSRRGAIATVIASLNLCFSKLLSWMALRVT